MGYIATGYGTSAPGYTQADIEAQMTDWSSWYGVTKFFFAQAPTATTYQPYYDAPKTGRTPISARRRGCGWTWAATRPPARGRTTRA